MLQITLNAGPKSARNILTNLGLNPARPEKRGHRLQLWSADNQDVASCPFLVARREIIPDLFREQEAAGFHSEDTTVGLVFSGSPTCVCKSQSPLRTPQELPRS